VRDDLIRVDDLPFDDVVGDRQERADEDAVAFGPFGEPRVPVGGGRQLLGVEAALRAGRHDHGVFHQLRLHQAEDFGAEVVAPVRPAQAPASNRAAAQVNALDARAVDPDFAPRHGRGQAGHLAGIELEGNRLLSSRAKALVRRVALTDAAEQAQDAVFVDGGDVGKMLLDWRLAAAMPSSRADTPGSCMR
jgi:hypothetical protein